MTTNTVTVANPITAAEPSDGNPTTPVTPTVTVTYYQQVAAQLMAAFDQAAQIVPKMEAVHVSTASPVRARLGIPMAFMATVTGGVEQAPELLAAQTLDVTAARETLQFLEAFRPVYDKAEAFMKNLKFTLDSRRSKLGTESLVTYEVAKGLARDPRKTTIAALVANMKRDLGLRGNPKTPAALRKTGPTPDNVVPRPRLLSGSEDAGK